MAERAVNLSPRGGEPVSPPAQGAGDGGGMDMLEARVARLEADMSEVRSDLKGLRGDVADMKADLGSRLSRMEGEITRLPGYPGLALIVGAVVGLVGAVFTVATYVIENLP
jgi:hypothetical protein